jgi:hypothetical protein
MQKLKLSALDSLPSQMTMRPRRDRRRDARQDVRGRRQSAYVRREA